MQLAHTKQYINEQGALPTYILVSSPLDIEENGAMGREIESRQGIGFYKDT
jgi:hypothetical protein